MYMNLNSALQKPNNNNKKNNKKFLSQPKIDMPLALQQMYVCMWLW